MIIRMTAFLHVMVNYRNDSETKAFVSECLKLKGAEHGRFFVANNSAVGPDDQTLQDLQQLSSHVSVLNCSDNPGYFGAAARALEGYDLKNFKFVILSNTDLEILNTDFYEQLLNLKWSSDIGSIAPSIRSGLSQKESNPLYWTRPSVRKIQFLKRVYSNFGLAWLYHVLSALKARFYTSPSILTGQFAYAPHGSFIILTDHYFSRGGDFYYPVRLYGEEIFLAESLSKMGLKVLLRPELKIFHREKGTEASWFHRVTLSKRTYAFKKEAAIFLNELFQKK